VNNDSLLLHQVHWAKLGADTSASVVSLALIWSGHRSAGVAIHLAAPVAGSTAVLALADMDRLRHTMRGRYALAHMPPRAQAVRLLGDSVMTIGAWKRDPGLVAAGLTLVAAGWSFGLSGSRWRRTHMRRTDTNRC
jgi:hypothetical protein